MTTAPATPLGAAIRRLRIERNLSQPQVAEALGCSVNAVSQFERGVTTPGVYALAKLANLLGVTYGALFDEPLALAEHAIAQVRAEVRCGRIVQWVPRQGPFAERWCHLDPTRPFHKPEVAYTPTDLAEAGPAAAPTQERDA